ncbi:E3 ubiquitin-protein ligase RNF19A-like [Varroa jacobsoni]|uniref:E3 ubiquitin-protein ligase RNF19A-like n=1 Tax=Varroa jacobsoni TaxID=62625 RepID=UPI000BF83D00|nr:E3 ubiquitin-protein ligase RNF19A-like [Varroa jacobsoni]XP_022692096.1 E3 ubiquitin-protein ligase RNF19A-like [Varroa jacobsoni]XP_022692097.1 E3 ubiquitin-protein ligase RNF19A-like [Varroa jacobsoni]
MTGPSSTRKSRFSLRSLFGSTPPATFTQFAARFVERQDASPEAVRQHSWNAESGTSGQGPDPALTGVVQNAHGGGAVIGKGGVRERTTDQGSHRQQQQLQHQLSQDAPTLECPLCLLELDREFFPKLTLCSHRACWDCLRRYLRLEISEGRGNIACPECAENVHPNDIQNILNEDNAAMAKYEAFMLRRVLATDPDSRWCPAPDCTFVVIANNCATCPKLKCQRPGCDTEFCYHCKQEWHPNITCDMARQQRQENGTGLFPPFAFASTSSGAGAGGNGGGKLSGKEEMKNCPSCGMQIIKADDGSCNHMTCGICGKEFCWLCVKQITDLHYLSPSGCTFWGKKPWSRKKKILWQLGMLVGAPVGIALIAGIAIPGIIIGIPVFIGKKVYAKCRGKSALKRNAAVTLGVILSMVFSPIVAAIAVGIGVPILLAYVYGVVPLSLLRSGGCGVKASSSGVRLEFDEGPGLYEQQAEEREKALDSHRDQNSQERQARGSQGGLSHSASSSSQQQHHHRRTSKTTISGTEDHISISVGDVDSVLSGRTQESGGGGSCAGASGSGRLHTVTVHMEQDRANQDSTRALAGSLLNYDPPVNEGTK